MVGWSRMQYHLDVHHLRSTPHFYPISNPTSRSLAKPPGPSSFLLLSFLLTLHHFLYSTLRLLLKNTPLAPLISVLSFLSPSITSGCILLTLYFYLHPPPIDAHSGGIPAIRHTIAHTLPAVYANVLRWVSPLFTLLEGISTLLVIQVAGRVGKGWADEEEREEGGVEWRSLAGLVVAALLYVAGLAGIVMVSATEAFLERKD